MRIPRESFDLAAVLHLPDDVDGAPPLPAVVLSTPGSSVKEQIGANYASRLAARGIAAHWHYVPLHSSPGGLRYGRTAGSMAQTLRAADCLLRLPLFQGLGVQQGRVIDAVREWAGNKVAA